jgi:hypothetical protein
MKKRGADVSAATVKTGIRARGKRTGSAGRRGPGEPHNQEGGTLRGFTPTSEPFGAN